MKKDFVCNVIIMRGKKKKQNKVCIYRPLHMGKKWHKVNF